jgi:hypothetical protein
VRTVFVILILILSLCGSASANWFNNSEKYLAACQNEASITITKTRRARTCDGTFTYA